MLAPRYTIGASPALLVLALFVIWPVATGHDLVTASAAAAVISWSADKATRHRPREAQA